MNDEYEDDIELLDEDERRRAALGLEEETASGVKKPMSKEDKKAVALLIVLCELFNVSPSVQWLNGCVDFIQGVPVSLHVFPRDSDV
jgi:hypothetical protein